MRSMGFISDIEILLTRFSKYLRQIYYKSQSPTNLSFIIIIYYYYYIYIALPCTRDRHSGALYNVYVQFKLDRLLLCCWLPSPFELSTSWLLCPVVQVESGWGICCSHQTAGWASAYTVANLPGHNYLQLTPIEFQDQCFGPRSSWNSGFINQLL